MPDFRRIGATERWLMLVIALICLYLSLATDTFFTLVNFSDLLNTTSVNIIFAAGLLVVLIAGGSTSPSRSAPRSCSISPPSRSCRSAAATG